MSSKECPSMTLYRASENGVGLPTNPTSAKASSESLPMSRTDTAVTTATVAPKKYSKEYFDKRIADLQSQILQAIPSKENLMPIFWEPLVSALEASQETLKASTSLQRALQSQTKKHPEDDGWKDASIVDPLKTSLQEAQATLDRLHEAATNAGCAIVQESGLLEETTAAGASTTPIAAATKTRGNSTAGSLLDIEPILLECTVLIQATPQGLADWCAHDPSHGTLLDAFLDQSPCMASFLEAGGPSHGNYGRALEIYHALQDELQNNKDLLHNNSSSKTSAAVSLLQRLALAVALELATPIPIFKQKDLFVDPLERFRYFAKFAVQATAADTSNEDTMNDNDDDDDDDALDESFATLTVWELRKVVDANATHEDLTWGRTFLRNYRPDQIYTTDERWRYVMSVRTDVGYRQPDHDFDNYPDLLSAGGECGPRAFFGRFVAKAWGMPTWGVRQPGHAAMSRFTLHGGWVTCLGSGWPYSWWDDDRYGGSTRHGPDFFQETQARSAAAKGANANAKTCHGHCHEHIQSENGDYYHQVVLLECLAECLGETVEEDYVSSKFWRSLALAQRNALARSVVPPEDAFSPEPCLEHPTNEWEGEPSFPLQSFDNDHRGSSPTPFCSSKRLSIRHNNHDDDGTIVLPAASFVEPQHPTKTVMVLKSFSGGDQLHLAARPQQGEDGGVVAYQVPSTITAGSTFALTAKVVNVHRNQIPLIVRIETKSNRKSYSTMNSDKDSDHDDGYELIHLPQGQSLEVPYTRGSWKETESIRVDLGPGDTLQFSRDGPCWGLSIKEFYLSPV